MVTETELYVLDLSSFTTAVKSFDKQLQASREKLGDIAYAKEIPSSNMQGQSTQTMISKLDMPEQRINARVTAVQQTQVTPTAYHTNKQQS